LTPKNLKLQTLDTHGGEMKSSVLNFFQFSFFLPRFLSLSLDLPIESAYGQGEAVAN
jgi:hypothetical protein